MGRLVRFFGGGIEFWFGLDTESVAEWVHVLEVLEARETLVQLHVSGFPNMKREQQEKLSRGLYKQANPGQEKRALTLQELNQMLRG